MSRTWTFFLPLTLFIASGPVQAQLPAFWGMTPMGGANNKGTLFRIDPDGTDFQVMHHFSDSSGWGPEGTLCDGGNGKLYGTTNLGGAASPAAGTLFAYTMATNTFTKLVDFDISNGGFGWGGMIQHTDGMLYGATYGGGGSGGSIYRVDPLTDSYTIVHPLDQATEGGSVNNRLTVGDDGLLYGSAGNGGANNAGTLFRFDPANNTFTTLHEFDGAFNGLTPYGGLCDAGNGWFYGTTWEGGTDDEGILFKYAPTTDTFVKLIDFTGPNGQSPWSSPVRMGAQLYGTVTLGGSNGGGFVYQLDPANDAFTELYAFNLLDGGTLFGNVLVNGGQLYGIGSFGGTNYQGTVYRIDPMTGAMTNLHSFADVTDGYSPRGDLIAAGTAITGVDERAPAVAFSVHPNPTHGPMSITLQKGNNAMLRIRNSTGQLVHQQRITSGTTTLEPELRSGLHVLEVELDGQRSAERIIVE